MAVCPYCNANIPDNSLFCTNCGVQFGAVSPADPYGSNAGSNAQNPRNGADGAFYANQAPDYGDTVNLVDGMQPNKIPQRQTYGADPQAGNADGNYADPNASYGGTNYYDPNTQYNTVDYGTAGSGYPAGQDMQNLDPGMNGYNNVSGNPNMMYTPPYNQNPPAAGVMQQKSFAAQLKTNRSMIKMILLSLITCGIYGLITYGQISEDVNLVCFPHDGRKSMNFYLLFFLVGPVTLEIATLVWMNNICERMGTELKRRQIDFSFGAKDFWGWGFFGSLILVGPFIFLHKFIKASNLLNENYNQFG